MPPKRTRDGDGADAGAATEDRRVRSTAEAKSGRGDSTEHLVFEDPYEDVYASSSDEEMEAAANGAESGGEAKRDTAAANDASEGQNSGKTAVWRPDRNQLQDGEVLDFDESTYTTYHSLQTKWPCLSFDIITDQLGSGRTKFPLTAYIVAGTQADRPENNEVLLVKLSDLHKTQREDDDEDDDLSDLDDDPIILSQSRAHPGGVNRIRSMRQAPHVVASWADTGSVHIWKMESELKALDSAGAGSEGKETEPVHTYTGHPEEGYALAWSPVKAGRLASGDCASNIHVWDVAGSSSASSWTVDAVPYTGHTDSVEDIQWSWSEENVFASCSVDRTVRIFDTRRHGASMLDVMAHETDVNVISWNPLVGFLLASGCDDGSFKIWDLRQFNADTPVAHFRFHQQPVTSIEWSYSEDSVLATSSADNSCIVWDMSLEEDKEELQGDPNALLEGVEDIPPQLLFCHQGQRDIKELHFHPQIPGLVISTAADSFNVWKPFNA